MIFKLIGQSDEVLFSETYFSIGGGFISTLAEIEQLVAPLKMNSAVSCPHPFDTARSMLQMATDTGLSIAAMKRINEREYLSDDALNHGLDSIWQAMQRCIEAGLIAEGVLPGGLVLARRAKRLHEQLQANTLYLTRVNRYRRIRTG